MTLTEAQRISLSWLHMVGDSTHMPLYQSRGLPSLERRGLVTNIGGRGRDRKLVLTAEGKTVAAQVHAERHR